MSEPDDEPRTWARLDRTARQSPQRVLGPQMRANSTDTERKLWWNLRHRLKTPATHFRRQVRIRRYQVRIRRYIADFACHSARIVVEVDGGQRAVRTEADTERTKVLEANGYRVLRFWNNDVPRNIDGVLEEIQGAIPTTPTPSPSPQGGGEKEK
jgi:very-short-patch-repair endonuclease